MQETDVAQGYFCLLLCVFVTREVGQSSNVMLHYHEQQRGPFPFLQRQRQHVVQLYFHSLFSLRVRVYRRNTTWGDVLAHIIA